MFNRLSMAALFLLALASLPSQADLADGMNIYIDADFSQEPHVGEAIELGLNSALAETGGRIAGLPVSVRRLDHRTSPRRSKRNFATFLKDRNAIAMFGGKQSPPYLTYGAFINANQVPLLLGWAAAAPVTRMADGNANYIFRLSVDDSQAGPFLVDQALAEGCQDIALVLVDTGWGRANLDTMTAALAAKQRTPALTVMVPTDTGSATARNMARDIDASGVQCVLAVLTVDTGETVLAALHELAVPVDVLAHWGIVGAGFPLTVTYEMRETLRLRILQTCGLSIERTGSRALSRAIAQAAKLNATIHSLSDIDAHAGFVHGYDLGRIFRAAAEQAAETDQWSDGPMARRAALRDALAALEQPVDGILKVYHPPFADLSQNRRDGHEALGKESLCLAKFDEENRIVPVQ